MATTPELNTLHLIVACPCQENALFLFFFIFIIVPEVTLILNGIYILWLALWPWGEFKVDLNRKILVEWI